jgi:hypothetical protein
MASEKNFLKKITIIVVLIFLCISVNAQTVSSDWINFTSLNDIRRLLTVNDTMFVATSGGLLIITDNQIPGEVLYNNSGLGTNDLYDITIDNDGIIWIAGHGRLVRYNGLSFEQFLLFDIDNNLISALRIVDDSDYLWVGLENSLILFDKNSGGGEFLHEYDLFGNLNPSPTINDIQFTGDSIWIATSDGLAVADRTDLLQLYNRNNWISFDIDNFPELNSNDITGIRIFQNNLYLTTSESLYKLFINSITSDTLFLDLNLGTTVNINDLDIINDSLFVFYSQNGNSKISYINDLLVVDMPINGLISAPTGGARLNNQQWVSTINDGIYYFDGNQFDKYQFTGLPGNDVTDITINQTGDITIGVRGVDFARYNDPTWIGFEIWVGSGTTRLMADSLNGTWMGTRGNGLWFTDESILLNYDETNSPMRGNTDNPPIGETFVYISGLDNDGQYIYTTCYRALNGYPLVIGNIDDLNNPSGWDSVGINEGLTDAFLVDLDYYNGLIAVASESDGIFECTLGNNPLTDNIDCQHYTRENSLLISNSVRAVVYSNDGILWVGTNFGLSWFDRGIGRFIDFQLPAEISSDITSLESDSRGFIWIGTRNGLGRIETRSGNIATFTTASSDLVSDRINNISVDRLTGNTYVATEGGFSIIPSLTGQPTFDVEQVLAFPNPFVVNDLSDRLNFNFGNDGTVTIFSVAGERIDEFPVNQGWDGNNLRGEPVVSGVYLFLVIDSNGNKGRGKFLLVRQ